MALSNGELKVLAVDCDGESLSYLSRTLGSLGYEVRTSETANHALYLLRQNPDQFQIVLAEAFSPEMDMDGFKLLAAVMAEFQSSIQVVLFSSFCSYYEAAKRALKQGASAFYTKPIPIEVLKHLWQLAFKKNTILPRSPPLTMSPSVPNLEMNASGKKRKRDDDDRNVSAISGGGEEKDEESSKGFVGSKKIRVCWLPELHEKFVAAVEFLIGTSDSISPRKILDVMEKMGVVGLSVPQVSSHLQQYRKRTLVKSTKNSSSSSSESELEDSSYTFKLVQSSSDAVVVDSGSDFFSSPSQSEMTSIQHAGETPSLTQIAEDDWSLDIDFSGVEPEVILNLLENN